MAGRRITRVEKCNFCGTQQLVPYETQIFRCGVCQGIIQLPRKNNDQWLRLQDSVLNPGLRFRTVVETAAPGLRPILPLQYAGGRKRAVLCGVTYKNTNWQLKGSVNDVKCMQYLLAEKLHFPKDSILILTEEEKDPYRIPTLKNMRMAMRWLVQGAQRGDSLVFYFSGHGSSVPDYNHDEKDGYNETLCPVDYLTAGMIIDDEINATIVRPLPKGACLHAIVDACHSGTILDLQYVYRPPSQENTSSWDQGKDKEWEDQECGSGVYKGTRGGLAISISACTDSQTSVDTTAFTGNVPTGALTYTFIRAVEKEPRITYGRLINSMRNGIREAHPNAGSISSFVNKLVLRSHFSQEPQLSSSERFDVSRTQFLLL